jgi:uncharacterized protein involved in exopolysaccharide biosynthesis
LIDFPLLLERSLRRWTLLLPLILLAVPLTLLVLAVLPPVYTAEAVIGPPGQKLDTSVSGGSLTTAGIASRLGLTRSSGQDSAYDRYLQLLVSTQLAAAISHDHKLMQIMFEDRWDGQTQSWIEPSGPTVLVKNFLKTLLKRPIKRSPDQDDVYGFLKFNLVITSPPANSFSKVSINFNSRAKAQQLLNGILDNADALIRNDRRRDIEARTVYLENVLPNVQSADQKLSLTSILSQQQQSLMEILADKRYSFTMVVEPYAPLTPTSPKPNTILTVMLGLAFIVWLGIVYFVPSGTRWLGYTFK